jgi:hypothetical protein
LGTGEGDWGGRLGRETGDEISFGFFFVLKSFFAGFIFSLTFDIFNV